jgi:hypothetical protein
MPATQRKRKRAKSVEPRALTQEQSDALIIGDYCPECHKPNVLTRPWREDFYCGWCRSVFKVVGRKLCYVGNQKDLD